MAIKNGMVIKLEKGKKLMGIVDEDPEEVEDPFDKEEEEDEKKKKKEKEKKEKEKKKDDEPEDEK